MSEEPPASEQQPPRDRISVRMWGVRGSTPTPRASNLGYGGNTACVEVRLPGDEILVLDAGSGLRELGLSLEAEFGDEPLTPKIFLTHFHWDHIQGIPFFRPLQREGNEISLIGHGFSDDLSEVLGGQMIQPYFPVEFALLPAKKHIIDIEETALRNDTYTVRPFRLNHGSGALGYRIESRGKVLVYATDLEHGHLELDGVLRQFSEGADILFFDSMYTPQDYEEYRGWGHSTWLEATRVARDAGVDRVILFHHNPDYDDARLDAIEQEAKEHFSGALMAREGTTLIL